MDALPKIVRGDICYRLPLTRESAACLVDALLANTSVDRARWVQTALSQDPPFALWCVLRTAESGGAVQNSQAAIVDWLTPRLAAELAVQTEAIELDANATDQFYRLLDHERTTARFTREISQKSENAGQDACLLGLLHQSAKWLNLFGRPQPDNVAAAAALPEWLASAIARINQIEPAAGSIEGCVRQAIVKAETIADQSPQLQPEQSGESRFLWQLAAKIARLEKLETDFTRALEDEKLSALKEFAYGAGHEINNPLANISARAQTLLKMEQDADRRQKLASINSQAFRAHEMIADLMLFARPPQMKLEQVDLGVLLQELQRAWQLQATEQNTELKLDSGQQPLFLLADRVSLAVALRALVSNALEAVSSGGRVEIGARLTDVEIAITVHDNGPGIDPEIRRHIFDPFFSGREAGRGLGFGLPKAWRIITMHAGRMDIDSDVGTGSTFTLTLPINGPPAGAKSG